MIYLMDLPINIIAEILSSLEVTEIKNLINDKRIWQDAFNFVVIHNMYMCAYSNSSITRDIFLSGDIYNFDFYPLEFDDTKNVEGTLYLNLQMLNIKYDWNGIIPDRFLEYHNFKNVILEKGDNITHIRNKFLNRCTNLNQIDLEPLSNITNVKSWFLDRCTGLTEIDLEPLSNITQIEYGFLYGCSCLTKIDLEPLSNIAHIEYGFLGGCSSLTKIDLTPLSNVTYIDCWFLCGCSGLTEIDLTPLSNITEIKFGFLGKCSKLISIKIPQNNEILFKEKFSKNIEIIIV